MRFSSVIFPLAVASLALLPTACRAQQIAFTWDDLPSHSALPQGTTRTEIAGKILAAMKAQNMPPVYGFVNGARSVDEPTSMPVLQQWRDAGLPLGNHAWSHMNLGTNSLEDWEADVVKNEPLLEKYMAGADWHWLRFPNLSEGSGEKRDGARAFLAKRGYKIAAVTMSFADYSWNDPYARCVATNDTKAIGDLESSYLAAAQATFDHTRALSKAAYGRDIPYVLLMHVGAFDARMLPRLLDLYKKNGATFITLQEAEKDEFYKSDLDPSLPPGESLDGAVRAKGLTVPRQERPAISLGTICK